MISASTFAFVLALVAAACAALAWITSLRLRLELESWRSTNGSAYARLSTKCVEALQRMQKLAREMEAKTPEKLAAEVAALSEAVAKLADTQRRFQGRYDAEKSLRRQQETVPETPEETRARLRRDHGLPKLGNGKPLE